jgi:hypothetical protein
MVRTLRTESRGQQEDGEHPAAAAAANGVVLREDSGSRLSLLSSVENMTTSLSENESLELQMSIMTEA